MRTRTIWLGLSLMVALGFWADRLPAQTVMVGPSGEQVFVVPTVPYEPALIPPIPSSLEPPPPPGPARHRLQRLLNQHGLGCESNAPWGACGNIHYDYHFIFGSCRTFFRELCEPNQHGSGK